MRSRETEETVVGLFMRANPRRVPTRRSRTAGIDIAVAGPGAQASGAGRARVHWRAVAGNRAGAAIAECGHSEAQRFSVGPAEPPRADIDGRLARQRPALC
ncbi:hypothetical protein [Lysobacter gummosus]|uniref:hypothetical protein n=1 Tax=Lysobacter gummosus TaxID=262324 RepID=UPI0036339560